MTNQSGPGRPPAASRFGKGQSGNPKGRPRSKPRPAGSAFDVVIDRTLTVTQGGQARELTLEEALQHKTYQAAIAGNRAARREVLKMIAKREKWLAAKAPQRPTYQWLTEPEDPTNANEALLLLEIGERDPRDTGPNDPYERLLLQPWAVQAALRRRRRRRLSEKDIADIKRCTSNADSIHWPVGSQE